MPIDENNGNIDRRTQLMKIALEKFARHGYHQTKISDIVQERA